MEKHNQKTQKQLEGTIATIAMPLPITFILGPIKQR